MPSAIIRTPAALLVALAAAALSLCVPGSARAAVDGAGTGVARISLIAGDVAIQRGDSAAPVAAALNAPLLGADYVKTGDASQAEIQFDGTSMVRLGAGVQMRFTHLDTGNAALELAQGTIELRLLHAVDGTYAVDTPSIAIRARQSGIYRVTVTDDGQTLVTVRSGEAEIVTPQDDRMLDPGTTLIVRGAATSPTLQSTTALAYDDFDRFNKVRDDRHERALADASSYANPNLEGIDALDGYGRWVNDGSYGQVWTPYNARAGWAPYRDGRWVWEDRYGWTWVADEPWGWAPYHYGRWYRSTAYGWCWYPPSSVDLLPVWQPGLVAFLVFGSGNIGWVPLAPYEPYYPWGGYGFGYGPTYVTNVTNVYNVYGSGPTVGNGDLKRFYKNAPYGTTAQPGKRFLLGKFDHPVAVPPAQLAHVQLVKGALPAVPTAANLRFADTPVARKLLTVVPSRTRLFAGDANVTRRIPFEQQRAAVATGLQTRAVQSSITRAAASVRAGVSPSWQRFGAARAPEVIVGGAERAGVKAASRPAVVTNPAAAAPSVPASNTARGAGDPWSRFVERGEATSNSGTASRRAPYDATARPPSSDRTVTHREIESNRAPAAPRERTVSAPVGRTAPVERAPRVERAAPVQRAAPVERAAPAERTAPAPRQAAAPPANH